MTFYTADKVIDLLGFDEEEPETESLSDQSTSAAGDVSLNSRSSTPSDDSSLSDT